MVRIAERSGRKFIHYDDGADDPDGEVMSVLAGPALPNGRPALRATLIDELSGRETANTGIYAHTIMTTLGVKENYWTSMNRFARPVSCRFGEFIVLPVDYESKWQLGEGKSNRVLHVALDRDLIADWTVKNGGVAEIAPRHNILHHDIEFAFNAVLRVIRSGETGLGLWLDSMAHWLTSRLVDLSGTQAKPPAKGGIAGWQMTRLADYIEANLERNLTIEELASLAGLSSFHFVRMFKLSTGRTPHQYLVHRRLCKARELLVGTDIPVTSIAPMVGYDAPQSLARVFMRETGLTPTQFRAVARS